MKQLFLLILLATSLFSTVRAETVAGLDELLAKYQKYSGFSGTVLVVKNGQPLVSRAVGYADDATLQPVTLLTRFDIGSIQKNLTAVLVLQAIDRGLLSLDDTVDKFSLGFSDPRVKKVTIKHLLEHRSGFADIFSAEYREKPANYDTIAKKLGILEHEPLLFEPGRDRRYSNYGYIVLGAILEKITKDNYWNLLEKNVLEPSRSTLSSEQVSQGNNKVATPYHLNYEGKRLPVAPHLTEHKSPDGGGQMTAFELYAFYHKLFKDKELLTAKSLQALKSLQKEQLQWLAFGGGRGVSAAVELDLSNDIWVIVLSNTDRLVAEKLSSRLRDLITSGQYSEVRLPATLFTYQHYKQMEDKVFNAQFEELYNQAGYQTFIGKTVTDLARELIAAEEAEESIPLFRYLTHRFPEHAEVYDGLAYGYFSSGRIGEARNAFAKATELRPDYKSQFNGTNYEAVDN